MPRRTFADFTAAVLERLGNRGDATPVLRAQWVNDALLWTASVQSHGDLEKVFQDIVPEGDDLWAPVTDIWWPKLLKCVETGKVLEPDNQEHIERGGEKSVGHPSRYYYFGLQFFFNTQMPAGGSPLKLWYYVKPTELSGATDLSPLQREFDPVIEHYAVKIGFEYFREYEKSALAEIQARNVLADLSVPIHKAKLEDNMSGLRPRIR